MSYIGITGIVSREESEITSSLNCDFKKLMVSVLVTKKTLNQCYSKSFNRYPLTCEIKNLFIRDSQVMNMISFSTDDDDSLLEDMIVLTGLGGRNLHGLRISNQWPKLETFIRFKEMFPNISLALQIDAKAIGILKNDNRLLVQKVRDYSPYVDFFFIDLGGDVSKLVNVDRFHYLVFLLRSNKVSKDIILSGGFNDQNVSMVKNIVRKFPKIGINAEAGLRGQNDFLDMKKVQKYIANASKILSV